MLLIFYIDGQYGNELIVSQVASIYIITYQTPQGLSHQGLSH